MFVGYTIESCCGQDYINPVCILQNQEDVKKYRLMSNRKHIIFQECSVLDLSKVREIRYVDVVYKNSGEENWKVCFTNDFETKNIKDVNKITIFNGTVNIKKVLKDNESSDTVAEKLLKICPHLAFKKGSNELTNYEETGIITNGTYIEVDIDNLLESFK